jgi:hypothetical protein
VHPGYSLRLTRRLTAESGNESCGTKNLILGSSGQSSIFTARQFQRSCLKWKFGFEVNAANDW